MTAAEQWIAKRRDHEGRGQRLHHSDYDRSLDALEKVLDLAHALISEGAELQQVPGFYVEGRAYVGNARRIREAIESALVIEAGDDQ